MLFFNISNPALANTAVPPVCTSSVDVSSLGSTWPATLISSGVNVNGLYLGELDLLPITGDNAGGNLNPFYNHTKILNRSVAAGVAVTVDQGLTTQTGAAAARSIIFKAGTDIITRIPIAFWNGATSAFLTQGNEGCAIRLNYKVL